MIATTWAAGPPDVGGATAEEGERGAVVVRGGWLVVRGGAAVAEPGGAPARGLGAGGPVDVGRVSPGRASADEDCVVGGVYAGSGGSFDMPVVEASPAGIASTPSSVPRPASSAPTVRAISRGPPRLPVSRVTAG
ncbi:hypothetical protein GCM10023403_07340 [Pseudonocardia benzenivorans]|nr:hypothetical protein PSD17_08710 [Pseudonocardia sp. D17]